MLQAYQREVKRQMEQSKSVDTRKKYEDEFKLLFPPVKQKDLDKIELAKDFKENTEIFNRMIDKIESYPEIRKKQLLNFKALIARCDDKSRSIQMQIPLMPELSSLVEKISTIVEEKNYLQLPELRKQILQLSVDANKFFKDIEKECSRGSIQAIEDEKKFTNSR